MSNNKIVELKSLAAVHKLNKHEHDVLSEDNVFRPIIKMRARENSETKWKRMSAEIEARKFRKRQ